jgi:hypothetical protein
LSKSTNNSGYNSSAVNANLLAQAGLEAARLLGGSHQDSAKAAAAVSSSGQQKKEDAQTQQQRQAAAKLALRKQLEKTLLQVHQDMAKSFYFSIFSFQFLVQTATASRKTVFNKL